MPRIDQAMRVRLRSSRAMEDAGLQQRGQRHGTHPARGLSQKRPPRLRGEKISSGHVMSG